MRGASNLLVVLSLDIGFQDRLSAGLISFADEVIE
jgi:hypothetical protein